MNDQIIEAFKAEILPKLIEIFHPEEIILFGSRVLGSTHNQSDLDVIVISSVFTSVPVHERFPYVRKRIRAPYVIDYLCYTPEEFKRMRTRSSVLVSALSGPHQVVLAEG